jgi:hypothetical protein
MDTVDDLPAAASALSSFVGGRLTSRIASLERALANADCTHVRALLGSDNISSELLRAAYHLKREAGQIHIVIHAIGILLCLPQILSPGETIQHLSLGAGSSGKRFDLETDWRVGEFKFIHWQGGAETIRQNALFKDFYRMAEHSTGKQKFMYVLGKEHPIAFLNSGRTLRSVMSRNGKMWEEFQAKYGANLATVADYYQLKRAGVQVEDVSAYLPELTTGERPARPSARRS